MTIDELYDLSEPTGCVVIVKVLKIVNDQGWYYTICSNCNGVVKPLDAAQSERDYNCENCKKKADLLPRIKVQIHVQYDTGSASFCLFQQDVAKVLGKSVAYLISQIDKASQSESNEKAESHDMKKKPTIEHEECETSAEERTKRKNIEPDNSGIAKKPKVDHEETKAEII